MLQVQSIAKDLAPQLAELEVDMPTFLFATGQMSCTEYVEGSHPETTEETRKNLKLVESLAGGYTQQQESKGNALWQEIFVDPGRYSNFLQRSGGKLVWVDPLFWMDPTTYDKEAYKAAINSGNHLAEVTSMGGNGNSSAEEAIILALDDD